MKTDKLFYRLFYTLPNLVFELLEVSPPDCQYSFSAPVVKEKEFRLDGLFLPDSDNLRVPLVVVEAQMQPDESFYSRFFAEIFLYLHQHSRQRDWQGLILLRQRGLSLGSELPYAELLEQRVRRVYLEDLVGESHLSPSLALLRLLMVPDEAVPEAVKEIWRQGQRLPLLEQGQILELLEAIVSAKLPGLSLEEIRAMLDLKEADLSQTQFYRDILAKGLKEGLEQGIEQGIERGELAAVMKLLSRKFGGQWNGELEGSLTRLSRLELELLLEDLLDFKTVDDLQGWLRGVQQS